MYCRNCGTQIADRSTFCESCGTAFASPPRHADAPGYAGAPAYGAHFDPRAKSRIAAGLLGIFLGHIGIHRFFLGYIGIGILQIFVTLITFGIGGLWGFVEGILILTGSINRDAKGVPLRD